MFDFCDLQFLSALVRHKHFARAAADCGVSQPAFSMRIRALEEKLNTPIVRRGNRYQGLTPEGEAILRHARPILDEMRAMEQGILAAKGEISGTLILGVIPTAAAYAARLAIQLRAKHPGIIPRIETASSIEIQQWIEDGTIDAGITYSDNVVSDLTTSTPLYNESYRLLAPTALVAQHDDTITWADAAKLPLSLLEPRMQNRRILDAMFQEIGAHPQVIAEASAVSICMSMACEGLAATVVPQVILDTFGPLIGTKALTLIEPSLTKSICLISATREPGLPTVNALRQITQD